MDTTHETRPIHLRAWRRHRLMTQAALAEATGLHPKTVYNLEQPGHGYSMGTLKKLAGGLGVKPSALYKLPTEND